MAKRLVRLTGPGAKGVVVNAALLRDMLSLIVDGSQRALRLRTQGRSTARGSLPGWIAAASDMDLRILEGSTVLELNAPTLLEADPKEFAQQNLFPEVDPELTGIDYLSSSLEAATGATNQSLFYDKQLLELFVQYQRVFDHGIDTITIEGRQLSAPHPVKLARHDFQHFAELESRIPPPQEVTIAGKLDSIRHSDRTFVLELPNVTDKIRGIVDPAMVEALQDLWGQPVLVSGLAHFAPDSRILRIEAVALSRASEHDLELWADAPQPLEVQLPQGALKVAQGPRSGLNAIFGRWPGAETDVEIEIELEQLS